MNRQVLLLEDDPTIRRMITTLLSIKGYEVDTVERGDEALRQIAVCAYGVIIVDVVVPAYSGTDVLAALRVLYPDLLDRVIVVTGFPDQASVSEAAGRYVEVIGKPFDVDVLLEAVDRRAANARNVVALGSTSARRLAMVNLFEHDSEMLQASAGLLTRVRDSLLHVEASYGYEESILDPYFPLPVSADIPIAISVREKRPLYFGTIDEAALEYPHLLPVWRVTRSDSLAAVPLCLASVPVGVIGWSWAEKKHFDEESTKRMAGLARRYELLMSALNFSEGHQARSMTASG